VEDMHPAWGPSKLKLSHHLEPRPASYAHRRWRRYPVDCLRPLQHSAAVCAPASAVPPSPAPRSGRSSSRNRIARTPCTFGRARLGSRGGTAREEGGGQRWNQRGETRSAGYPPLVSSTESALEDVGKTPWLAVHRGDARTIVRFVSDG
jgi:hypothetical protein